MHSPLVVQVAQGPVAVVAHLLAAATVQASEPVMALATVVVDLAEAPAPRTQVSRARTPVTDSLQASRAQLTHCANVMHNHHESMVNSSARTHAAHALIHAQTSATTLTNASLPAMCPPAFHHLACLPAVAAVAAAVIVAVMVAVHAQAVVAAVVTGVILAAALGANSFQTH